MATKAQLAALKKARAAKKKKDNSRKKRVGTSQTKRSMATKNPPSKRLKKRRLANTEPGYYPNPKRRTAPYVVKIVAAGDREGYLTRWLRSGPKFDTSVSKAHSFTTKAEADMVANMLASGYYPTIEKVGAVKK